MVISLRLSATMGSEADVIVGLAHRERAGSGQIPRGAEVLPSDLTAEQLYEHYQQERALSDARRRFCKVNRTWSQAASLAIRLPTTWSILL